jgi:hypothetical protein
LAKIDGVSTFLGTVAAMVRYELHWPTQESFSLQSPEEEQTPSPEVKHQPEPFSQ